MKGTTLTGVSYPVNKCREKTKEESTVPTKTLSITVGRGLGREGG